MWNDKWRTVADVLKAVGEKESFSMLRTGAKQQEYRKAKNLRDSAILAAAKNDPRFKDLAARSDRQKTGTDE